MNDWREVETASLAEVRDWAAGTPWGRVMAACSQDAAWHAEGDVWTHTTLVLDELPRLEGWDGLSRDEQLALVFTALFHDAGKPATTMVDDSGRMRSPKHAVVGMELARRELRDLGCPLLLRETICNLVRYHGRPPFVFEKPDPTADVIHTSWLLPNRLLYLFALADTRGRTTVEMSRPEETLHLWKLLAEEHDCFVKPYPFANDQARFFFYRGQLSSLHYVPREDYSCAVTLMAGLPGAGKDTWLRTHRPNLPVVSLDDLREELDVAPTDEQGTVIQTARERCREHLRAKRDFAFNATNTMALTRKRWIDLFADYQARVEIVYLEPPSERLRKQNRDRSAAVPQRIMEKLLANLEPPTWSESHLLCLESTT